MMRSLKHDMQAHMIVLKYYLDTENYEDAKAYLQTMQNQPILQVAFEQYDVGNPLVNSIIEGCLTKTEQKIKLVVEGEIGKDIKMSDYDLCILFSNIMTNAIEACEKLLKLDKTIYIKIHAEQDKVNLCITNPIEWELDRNGMGCKTTKNDKHAHGYGMSNIQKVVQKYNGNIDVGVEENMFLVKIILPIGSL